MWRASQSLETERVNVSVKLRIPSPDERFLEQYNSSHTVPARRTIVDQRSVIMARESGV